MSKTRALEASRLPPEDQSRESASQLPRSVLFLAAFNRAERALRGMVSDPGPFRQMLSQARRTHALVRRYYEDLVELSELRNAIVHDSVEPAEVIAEPAQPAVALMTKIADLLEQPPTLISLFGRKVARVMMTDPLKRALSLMVAHGYSQLPVYDARGRLMGLLTERVIARWYARSVVDARPVDPSLRVSDLLKRPDGRDIRNYVVMAAEATVFDAEEALVKNRQLEAIIITATGGTNERPIGIATDGDIARLPSE